METPATSVKKGFDVSLIITIIVVLVIINAILDVLGQFIPTLPAFVNRPVSTVKAIIASKTAKAIIFTAVCMAAMSLNYRVLC